MSETFERHEINMYNDNWKWCEKAAARMSAEDLMRNVVTHLMRPTMKRPTFDAQWAYARRFIMVISGEGPCMAAAILERFRLPKEEV